MAASFCRVSSIESRSSHPTSVALIHYAESRSIESKPEYVEDFQNFPGEGVSGKFEGKNIFIGNQRLGLRAGCKIGNFWTYFCGHHGIPVYLY